MSLPPSHILSAQANAHWASPSANPPAFVAQPSLDHSLIAPDHVHSGIGDVPSGYGPVQYGVPYPSGEFIYQHCAPEQASPIDDFSSAGLPAYRPPCTPIAVRVPQPSLMPMTALGPSAALPDGGAGPDLPVFPTPVQLLSDLANARFREVDAVEARIAPAESTAFTQISAPCRPSDDPGSALKRMRHHALSENLGFPVTDPDTVSAHDKKRNYLECLELYVQYLHEQLELAGRTPPELARVECYKGLSSRSVRTLLVHMRDNNCGLHAQVLDREREFLDLFDHFSAKERAKTLG